MINAVGTLRSTVSVAANRGCEPPYPAPILVEPDRNSKGPFQPRGMSSHTGYRPKKGHGPGARERRGPHLRGGGEIAHFMSPGTGHLFSPADLPGTDQLQGLSSFDGFSDRADDGQDLEERIGSG